MNICKVTQVIPSAICLMLKMPETTMLFSSELSFFGPLSLSFWTVGYLAGLGVLLVSAV